MPDESLNVFEAVLLNLDLVGIILSFSDLDTLISTQRVCKTFQLVLSQPRPWRTVKNTFVGSFVFPSFDSLYKFDEKKFCLELYPKALKAKALGIKQGAIVCVKSSDVSRISPLIPSARRYKSFSFSSINLVRKTEFEIKYVLQEPSRLEGRRIDSSSQFLKVSVAVEFMARQEEESRLVYLRAVARSLRNLCSEPHACHLAVVSESEPSTRSRQSLEQIADSFNCRIFLIKSLQDLDTLVLHTIRCS